MSQPNEATATPAADKKVTLTVSTIEAGDYTHDYPAHQKLQVVIDQTIAHLELTGEGPWVLEHDGTEIDPSVTIEAAGLKDGDVLTLSPQEGGGGSGRL
jgi:hypothetical protein